MRNRRIAIILVALMAIYAGSAFQLPPLRRPILLSMQQKMNTQLRVQSGALRPNENMLSDDDHYHSEILEGTSPKAIRLRKELQKVWRSPETLPILIIGPRGSGKASLVSELLDRLPSWQTENVHQLSMDEAVNHIDTMLGSETQPGLLDVLSDQKNTTLVLTSFQTRTVESADEIGRRQELFQTLASLVKDRTYYSPHDGQEKPFAPRIIATCSREQTFWTIDPISSSSKFRPWNRVRRIWKRSLPPKSSTWKGTTA